MAYNEMLAERIRRGFRSAAVRCEEKQMMGGFCFLVDGKMCVGIVKDRLMVRLDPAIYDEALQQKGCGPMDFTGRPMRGFVFIEPAGLETEAELEHWLKLALEFNPRAKSSKKKSASTPKARVSKQPAGFARRRAR